ncbi:TPA: hypothetical protein EYP66_24980 [Candidatus Poribacteria bacterium]|nr:hypothetical protein [Candidatus Poribacteria bacterium]
MDARILITILIGIIWLAFRLLRRKPEDTEQQEQSEGDIILTEAEMNLPWQQIPQGQQMFAEHDEGEEIGQVEEESRIEQIEEPPTPQPVSPPTASMEAKRETSQRGTTSMTSDIPAHSRQRLKQPKQIIDIPLNTQNVKFGIILSEILNKPKSQRPHT